MGQLLGPDFPKDIALAVSGGGDSMAMLALAHNWTQLWGVHLHVVTVDHGLRAESTAEAEMVAKFCADLGWPHTTLRWHWDGRGNVMDAARRARLDLIGGWLEPHFPDISHVLMAHTADDVTETFLLRLARGSGVEGLAAMRPRRRTPQGFDVIRPCLEMSRAELRQYARTLHVPWVEDPTNEDPSYDRSRARALLPALAELGLDAAKLELTAQRMRRASHALTARAVQVAGQVAKDLGAGALGFERDRFAAVERDTQMRLLAAACMWVSGADYRPRADGLEALLERVLAGGAGTLCGALLDTKPDHIRIFREPSAIELTPEPYSGPHTKWDHRWRITGPVNPPENACIAPLGDALSQIKDWRDSGLPRPALLASPAIFEGKLLISAPVLGLDPAWQAQIDTSFGEFLETH